MSIRETPPNYHELLDPTTVAQSTGTSSSSFEQSLSVSRSAILPSSTSLLSQEVVTNALSSVISEKEFKETLRRWVSEGIPEEERQEAADRILECFLERNPELNLSNLDLRSLPSLISGLTQLTYLDLSENQLTSIPESIDELTQLTTLSLRDNQLSSIPSSIGNLRKLDHLSLSSNQLNSIPMELVQLPDDCDVFLCSNPLSKEMLEQLENFFTQLERSDTAPTFHCDTGSIFHAKRAIETQNTSEASSSSSE